MKLVRAFTLVEVMILVVIIGLVLAVVIPACSAVRDSNVVQRVEAGGGSAEDRERYPEAKKRVVEHSPVRAEPETPQLKFQQSDVGAGPFYMVPKAQVKEVLVNGETYYLFSVPKTTVSP